MLQEKSYQLKSVCPLLMHNGQLADPLNDFAIAMKAISGKRNKTPADHKEMGRIEFLGGLYMGQNGKGIAPVIPPQNIRGMLIRAARKRKEGKLAESGLFVMDNTFLKYEGPTDPDEMWEDGRFTDRRMVVISRSRIARTRPVFNEWEATVDVTYDDEIISESMLDEWFHIAGRIIGQADNRPQNGRFVVV